MNTQTVTHDFLPENARLAVDAALKHSLDNDSAFLAALDARDFRNQKLYSSAINRALTSLSHSVGIFHPVYKQVKSFKEAI